MDREIELRSDNSAGVAPYVLDAVTAANDGSAMAYGDDDWTARLQGRVAEVFEVDQAWVFPVVSGTAANSLALSALCPPWGAVVCHDTAHITVNEAAGTSLFSGGAALLGVGGTGGRIAPDRLTDLLDRTGWGDPHRSQPSVLSLTQPTDLGTVYPLEHVAALVDIARTRDMRIHMDGARLANAIVALGCTPADATWRTGVEVFTLGATKNGALSTDAIVSLDPEVAHELTYRLKRAGHVASKMRFQSVQLDAYLTDDRWLSTARTANDAAARLATGLRDLGLEPIVPVEANMVFVDIDPAVADRWESAGLLFYRIEGRTVRFVTSFATTDDDVDAALATIATT